MCKIMIMPGITDETKDNAWAFTKAMAKEMSAPNASEKDGLGYAAIDNEGKLFGERWVNNREAFQHRYSYGFEVDSNILKRFKILNKEKVYGNFGTFSDKIRSITLHSRSATGTVSYKNTHPFVEGTTSVIHNGVIYNDDELTKKYSSCDSEVILHEYIKYNVANKSGKFKKLVNKLEGYFALGIFAKTNEGRVILDVIKDNTTKLDAFLIKELDTIVFATPKYTSSPVEEVCKTLGFTIVSKYEVKGNRLQRFDAITGEALAYESFKPQEFTRTTHVPTNKWNTDSYETYPYAGYNDYRGTTKPVNSPRFEEVFSKTNPAPKESNVVDINTHSKTKHDDAVKERHLEEMLMGNTEYTSEEVEKMLTEAGLDAKNFNDNGECDWEIDERLTWRKKTLA